MTRGKIRQITGVGVFARCLDLERSSSSSHRYPLHHGELGADREKISSVCEGGEIRSCSNRHYLGRSPVDPSSALRARRHLIFERYSRTVSRRCAVLEALDLRRHPAQLPGLHGRVLAAEWLYDVSLTTRVCPAKRADCGFGWYTTSSIAWVS